MPRSERDCYLIEDWCVQRSPRFLSSHACSTFVLPFMVRSPPDRLARRGGVRRRRRNNGASHVDGRSAKSLVCCRFARCSKQEGRP
jgi:hypothetical protein